MSRRNVAIAGVALSDCGRVDDATPYALHAQAARRALADAGLDRTAIDGDLPSELSSLLHQLVDTSSASAPPATSRLAIRQRGRTDQAQFDQALRAQGYFDGSVSVAIREPNVVSPEGIAAELERLATPPEAVLVLDVVPGRGG